MDIRKLLYKYKQFGEAKRTAEITIKTLEERNARYGVDENSWIRGSLPSNPVLSGYIAEEDTMEKIEYLKWVVRELDRITDAIQRAVKTLNLEQRRIIELRYFDGHAVTYICQELNIRENKYHYLHRTALEAMQAVINPLCIDDAYLDALLFTPIGTRLKMLQS